MKAKYIALRLSIMRFEALYYSTGKPIELKHQIANMWSYLAELKQKF